MNGNLLCANVLNMLNLDTYTKGVATYDKILSAYITSSCSQNNGGIVNITLNKIDYKEGTPEFNSESTQVRISCSELREKLNSYSDIINASSKYLSTHLEGERYTKYETTKNAVINDYQSLLNKRSQMDQQVQQLLGVDNTVLYEKQNILDSAVFTTLLWTVLATSALYYAFTKI